MSKTKLWKIRTGTIDVVGVTAESPMEAATLVFDQIKNEAKIDREDTRLFRIGLLTECTDMNLYKKNKAAATFYVLTSKVLANAGLHALSKQLSQIEKKLDKKKKNL